VALSFGSPVAPLVSPSFWTKLCSFWPFFASSPGSRRETRFLVAKVSAAVGTPDVVGFDMYLVSRVWVCVSVLGRILLFLAVCCVVVVC